MPFYHRIQMLLELCVYVRIIKYNYMWVCARDYRYLQKPEEGLVPPGAGDTGSCELPFWVLGLGSRSSARAIHPHNG